MALRGVLVAMVVCLGLELPKAEDLSGWNQSARSWISARSAEVSSLTQRFAPSNREEAAFEPVPLVSGRTDLAFEAVIEGISSGFATDLAANPREAPVLVEISEPLTFEASPTRSEKLQMAVRLTREAVDAWASLIQPTDEDDSPTR